MEIAGYLPTSLIEWPGKIASVIFTPGCNFRCPFCHNPDLVDPNRTRELKDYSDESIITDLEKREKWIDGVVITGGEPLLQKGLEKFLKKLKGLGLKTMIETNGSLSTILRSMADKKLVDYWAVDYKAPFEKYPEVVRVMDFEPAVIKKSIKLLIESKIPFELRTTIVPGIHDQKTLIKMAKDLKTLCPKLYALSSITWSWRNFRSKTCLKIEYQNKKQYDLDELNKFLKKVQILFPQIRLKLF
ncbi:anaerobic ribonucleoside-triphosphate reductase activating protein [Patescibacteria group bacterium]